MEITLAELIEHDKMEEEQPYNYVMETKQPKRFKYNDKLCETHLDNFERQILYGTMLGDGSIPNVKLGNLFLYIAHGDKQKDYLEWKAQALHRFNPRVYNYDGFRHEMKTSTFKMFEKLRKNFYEDIDDIELFSIKDTVCDPTTEPDYEKTFKTKAPVNYIRKLNYFGLLIWFLDDGTVENNCSFSISADRFKRHDIQLIINVINEKLNLNLHLRPTPKRNIVQIPKKSRDKLLPIWRTCFTKYIMPECMRYKLLLDKNGKCILSNSKRKAWTDREIELLQIYRSHMDVKELWMEIFPHRSYSSVECKIRALNI